MKQYAFIVVKHNWHTEYPANEFVMPYLPYEVFSHTYTLEVNDDEEPNFEEIASSFVAAERAVMPESVVFKRVLVLEHTFGNTFDKDTVCRVFWPRGLPRRVQHTFIGGWSRTDDFDRFVGVNIGRNRKLGRVTKRFYGGALRQTDLQDYSELKGNKRNITLKGNSEFQLVNLTLYNAYFPELYGVDNFASLNQWGYESAHAEKIGLPMVCEATEQAGLRRRHHRRGNQVPRYITAVEYALCVAQRELEAYEWDFDHFNHQWGNGEVPFIGVRTWDIYVAATIWYPFYKALGLPIPEGYQLSDNPFQIVSFNGFHAFANSIKCTRAESETLSCLEKLQQLDFEHKNTILPMQQMAGGHASEEENRIAHSEQLYENFETLNTWIFSVVSTLGTLQAILSLEEIDWPYRETVPKTRIPQTWDGAIDTPPLDWPDTEYVPFIETKPRDKEPYIKITEPNEIAVTLPIIHPPKIEVPKMVWDNTIHEDDDDDNGFFLGWFEWVAIAITLILITMMFRRLWGRERISVREIPAERAALREAFKRRRDTGYWVYKDVDDRLIENFVRNRWATEAEKWLARIDDPGLHM